MHKRLFLVIFALFVFGMVSIFSADARLPYESVLGKRTAKTESDKRIQSIEKIVYSFVADGRDIKDEKVQGLILKKVADEYPTVSGKTPREVDVPKIRKRADKMADKKYPMTDKELEELYMKKADELYQSLPLNTTVTITYKQGPYKKTITGRYFGLTYYNDGVNIENTVIPIFDMSDSDKSKFDAKLRTLRKKHYVSNQIEAYQETKKEFSDSIIRDKAEATVKNNEKDGFIYAWSEWRTPKDVADIVINYLIDKKTKSSAQTTVLF